MSNIDSEKITSRLYELFQSGGVSTDSRRITPGVLFFALRGDNFDGNQYAAAALDKGAAAVVVDRADVAIDDRYIVVEDSLAALSALASHHRNQLSATIIALTGSNGKTTTKELITRVLSLKYKVAATQGNLNNHIGVPLTLLSFDHTTQIGIVEMGANHLHEIEHLCRIARPEIGLITNIGLAHLEGFGGADGVRRGKGELFDFLAANSGTAIYRSDDANLCEMTAQHPQLRTIGYNTAELGLDVIPNNSPYLHISLSGHKVTTSMVGDYNIYNAAAAIAVGRYLDIDPIAALDAIAGYIPDNNRSQSLNTEHNTLYMDAYNANPSSMKASLINFSQLSVDNKVVIIGDMRELGDYSPAEHSQIASLIASLGLYHVYTVGCSFKRACRDMAGVISFSTTDQLKKHLSTEPLTQSNILIKGSRSIALEQLKEVL